MSICAWCKRFRDKHCNISSLLVKEQYFFGASLWLECSGMMGCLRCLSRAKSFHVKIILLDKQELIQEIQDKTTGQDLLDNIFKYLNLIETAYFGLRYQDSANQTVRATRNISRIMALTAHSYLFVRKITFYLWFFRGSPGDSFKRKHQST